MKRNGLLATGLLGFGAATSIAEIEAGIRCHGNLSSVLLGHLVGFALLFATGLVGGQTRLSAMRTTEEAFGSFGSRFFAGLNLLQLVGWATVMIALGATAATALFPQVGFPAFCLVIGLLTAVCLLVDFSRSPCVSCGIVGLLALLALFLTKGVSSLPPASPSPSPVPFGSAFELSVAMPLSWLPLVSDYTKDSDRPVAASAAYALAYSLVGVWMYVLGMMIASVNPDMGLTGAIVRTHVGTAGLVIVIVSAAVSAFFDAHSAGESALALCRFPAAPSVHPPRPRLLQSVLSRLTPKSIGLFVCSVGIILAVGGLMDRYADFLYLIASVFSPMAAVLLVSHYLVRRPRALPNLMAWLVGFLAYQFSSNSPLGPTLTAMLVSAFLSLALTRLFPSASGSVPTSPSGSVPTPPSSPVSGSVPTPPSSPVSGSVPTPPFSSASGSVPISSSMALS